MTIRFLGAFAALFLFSSLSVHAQTLPQPTGPIILTVTGAISVKNSPAGAVFDTQMLEALGVRTTTTKTPWTDGVSTFEGPLGRDLLTAVGAVGTMMKVKALNDFAAEVPVADFQDHDVILALKMNGAYMRVRDKGPVFIVYPFDEDPSLFTEVYFNRSVWQIKSIDIQ